MAITFFEDALVDGASAAGLFIPGTNLLGVTVGEFADAESLAKKRGKLCNGLARKICDYIIAQSNLLGFSATKGTPAGSGSGLFTVAYQLTTQFVVNWQTKAISPIPLASSGTNANYGRIGIKSIFPNAVVLASGDDIPSEGVLFPTADLQAYGGPAAIAGIEATNDNRDVIAALFRWMAGNSELLETTGNITAVTAQSVGTASSWIPAAALYAAENPTSGLTTPLSKYTFFQQSSSITLRYSIDDNTEVNV